MKRGGYVLRSTYQKVVEENKKLLQDIAVMVQEGINPEAILLKIEYREKFKKQRMLTSLIKDAAKRYLDSHPGVILEIKNHLKSKK
jgi:hypothetical protein